MDDQIERITISQAAQRFNLSARWIQKLVQRGDIPHIEITPRLFLVDPNDVAAWLVNAPQPGRPKKANAKTIG